MSGLQRIVLVTLRGASTMPSAFPPCPDCQSPYTYQDLEKLLCPECGHEWQLDDVEHAEHEPVVRDSNGNQLYDGDYVTLIKNLKVKGTSSVAKIGTKVKINRLVDGDHNIDCKIEGIGQMMLKSEFVKRA